MLSVEEIYLLLTAPNGEPAVHGMPYGTALNAAFLSDLEATGLIAVSPDEPTGDQTEGRVRRTSSGLVTVVPEKSYRIRVLREPAAGDLPAGYRADLVPTKDGSSLRSALVPARANPEQAVRGALISAGVLELGSRTKFGFGPRRTPERDPSPKTRIRARLTAAFAGEATPTRADATILATLHALRVAPQLLRDVSGARSMEDFELRLTAAVAQVPVAGVAQAVLTMDLGPSDNPLDRAGSGGVGIMDAGGGI